MLFTTYTINIHIPEDTNEDAFEAVSDVLPSITDVNDAFARLIPYYRMGWGTKPPITIVTDIDGMGFEKLEV